MSSASGNRSRISAGSVESVYLYAGLLLLLAAGLLAGTLQLLLVALRAACTLVLLTATHFEAACVVGVIACITAVVATRPWRRGSAAAVVLADAVQCAGGPQSVAAMLVMAAGFFIMALSASQFHPRAAPADALVWQQVANTTTSTSSTAWQFNPAAAARLVEAVDEEGDYLLLASRLLAFCDIRPPGRSPATLARMRALHSTPPAAVALSAPSAANKIVAAARLAARLACNIVIPTELRMIALPAAARSTTFAPSVFAASGAMLVVRLWLAAAFAVVSFGIALSWAELWTMWGVSAIRGMGLPGASGVPRLVGRNARCHHHHHCRNHHPSAAPPPRRLTSGSRVTSITAVGDVAAAEAEHAPAAPVLAANASIKQLQAGTGSCRIISGAACKEEVIAVVSIPPAAISAPAARKPSGIVNRTSSTAAARVSTSGTRAASLVLPAVQPAAPAVIPTQRRAATGTWTLLTSPAVQLLRTVSALATRPYSLALLLLQWWLAAAHSLIVAPFNAACGAALSLTQRVAGAVASPLVFSGSTLLAPQLAVVRWVAAWSVWWVQSVTWPARLCVWGCWWLVMARSDGSGGVNAATFLSSGVRTALVTATGGRV